LIITFLVNGHIESTYSVEEGKWTAPKFIEDPYLRVHGLSTALNYGQQVYEGLKGTYGTSGSQQSVQTS
jgi:branched-chain amino acid aminotransferase